MIIQWNSEIRKIVVTTKVFALCLLLLLFLLLLLLLLLLFYRENWSNFFPCLALSVFDDL